MAILEATILTGEQQAAIDVAATAILVQFPGLKHGEFTSDWGGREYGMLFWEIGTPRAISIAPRARLERPSETKEEATEGLGFAKLPAHRGNSEQFVKST